MANVELLKMKPKAPVLYVRGFPYPGHHLYSKEKIESALDYAPENGDVFIVTYPKSGTTWLTYLIWEILNKGSIPLPSISEMNYRMIPYLEMCGATAAEGLSRPRVFKYHSSYHLVPKSSEAKYIYLYRNPKDVCISRFFFTQEIYGRELDFEQFFTAFLSGHIAHGSWFDHVASWHEHNLENNVLFLSYEDLLNNTQGAVLKLAYFLGTEYGKQVDENKKLMEAILEHTSFDYMKANLPVMIPAKGDSGRFRKINFFRKGEAGDWKNYLSCKQSEMFDENIREKLKHEHMLSEFI